MPWFGASGARRMWLLRGLVKANLLQMRYLGLMTDAHVMNDTPENELPLSRRTALIKWLIFGVLLPLLPFAARALAAWVDNSSKSLTFNSLLSDGELLVVATVISAAVIGDLLFDFTGIKKTREQGAKALICAFALVVVIASVLMFGLVTLNNQDRNDSFLQAQEEVTTISSGGTALQAQSAEIRAQSDVDSEEVARLTSQIQNVLNQAKIAGKGPEYNALKDEAALLEQQESDASDQATQEDAQSAAISHESSQDQGKAQHAFVVSVEDLGLGEKQASYMSIIMFLISFSIGLWAYLLPSYNSNDGHDTSNEPRARSSVRA